MWLNSRGRGAVRSVVPPPFLVSPPSTLPQAGAHPPHLSCSSISALSLPPHTLLLGLLSRPPSQCLRGAGGDEESPDEAWVILQGWSPLTNNKPSACSCLRCPCSVSSFLPSHPSPFFSRAPLPWPSKDRWENLPGLGPSCQPPTLIVPQCLPLSLQAPAQSGPPSPAHPAPQGPRKAVALPPSHPRSLP